MSRVGKNTVALVATIMCMVFVLSIVLPLSGAQSTDTTPPVTSATVTGTAGNDGWYRSNPTVSLTAIDNGSGVAHTYYRLDSGAQVTYMSSFTVPDGNHTLIFYSVDNAGNTEPIIYGHNYLNIKADTVSPAMNMTIKGNLSSTGYYNGTATVNLTASDSCSGVSSISYSFDNTHWTAYTGNFTLPDGEYTLRYGSYDAAGNVYNNTTSLKVFNPEISFSPPCNTWYEDNITVLYGIPESHDVDHIDYSYDGKTWYHSNDLGYYPIQLTTEGNITIYYRAVNDTAGIISDIKRIWYGIDKYGPKIGISIEGSQSSSGWYNGEITIHINANDNGSISHTEYSWDNNNWNNYDGPFKASGKSRTIWYRTADMFNRTDSGRTWIYFAPGSYNQGSMSDSVWINGVLYGPSTGASPSDSEPEPTLTPTQVPSPTPTQVPSPTPATETTTGSSSPLTLVVLIGVVAIIIVAAAAAYFFMLKKPK